ATNQIAQTGLSSLPPVIYYSEQLFREAPALLVGSWKVSRHMDEDRHKTQALYISAPGQSVTTYFRHLLFGACFNKCQLIWLYKVARTGSGCLWGRWKGEVI
ncbi:hypothetical protein, partial [Aeromonas rivipollensis]|uniref:hypothetical protein n=1 Tax=Aeromonas rivipollensis TaxID=948519 RepID=UPI003D1F19AC